MTRPRGTPPTPSAMSRPSEPVGTTLTSGGAIPSPRRMMLPLPNCFSMVETARSIALSRTASRGGAAAVGVSLLSTFISLLISLFSLFSVVAMCSLLSVGTFAPPRRHRPSSCSAAARRRSCVRLPSRSSLTGVEVASRQVEGVVSGCDPYPLSPTGEELGRGARRAGSADREAHGPHGLVGRATGRAGDAGDGHRDRRAAHPLGSLGHLARRRLADRAEVGNGLGFHAEHACLDLVGVGDDAATEERARPRLRGDDLARHAAGARL